MAKIDAMNLEEAAWHLSDLLEKNRSVFLKTEPEVPDHTSRAPFKIIICGTNQRVDLDVTPENMTALVAIFDSTIFNKEMVDRLYAWNLKSLCTYFRGICPTKFITPSTEQTVLDLKPIENFLGVRKNPPENLVEAVNRVKLAFQKKGWQTIYKAVHLPLSLRILPTLETTPLLNEATKRSEYPYYEIEGIVSGRMNCLNKFAKCYNPHRLGPPERKNLKPRGYGVRFMCPDFRNCEITVLQWLSGDLKFKELLDSGEDVYAAVYEEITGDDCNTEMKRKMGKRMIISVMYGSGAATLADNLSIPEGVAKELIARIKVVFKTACDWMNEQRERAKTGVFIDYFGRPRDFADKPHAAPDIMVQGVAATVCQEKLIDLYGKLTNPDKAYIAYSAHDGYGLIVKVAAARETYKLVKEALETESKLCPGLKMKVQIKFGAKLDAMKELWKD